MIQNRAQQVACRGLSKFVWQLVLLHIIGFISTTGEVSAADWKFSVRMDPAIREELFSGRVYLFFSRHAQGEPRHGPDWFNPEPFVALDVKQWNPSEPLDISPATPRLLSFPAPLAELDLKTSRVQAVVRLNWHERNVGTGPGNGYSSPLLAAAPGNAGPVALVVDKLVPQFKFKDTEFCRELVVHSELLSQFHEHEINWKAAVQLPASYHTEPERRFPVIFNIPGFGGTHASLSGAGEIREKNDQGVEFIRVTMDPSCARGHHVFADSANNGPVGKSFITEFLPKLDAQFRTISAPTARFLTGHSSGGWSTLWLQTTYPDSFGGTWSTSPDSVDFTDFQRVNIYQPSANLFRDEVGRRRPLGRDGDKVLLWSDRFSDMEHVLDYGGQLQSFEAVFSPRGEDGQPLQLWDRRTGAIDHAVAEEWRRYDIRARLQKDWPQVGPQLQGKLHVFMGSEDTFYLEGATRNLKQTLTELGSDAIIEILPGKNHFNLFAGQLNLRIRKEMVAAFLKHHKPNQ